MIDFLRIIDEKEQPFGNQLQNSRKMPEEGKEQLKGKEIGVQHQNKFKKSGSEKDFEDNEFQRTLQKKFRSPKKQPPHHRHERGRISSN